MAKNKYRANATDIWKRPISIRYIWYVETEGKVYTGATWNSLDKALARGNIDVVKICDIKDNKVMTLSFHIDLVRFMEEWRNNYYNPDWKFSR